MVWVDVCCHFAQFLVSVLVNDMDESALNRHLTPSRLLLRHPNQDRYYSGHE